MFKLLINIRIVTLSINMTPRQFMVLCIQRTCLSSLEVTGPACPPGTGEHVPALSIPFLSFTTVTGSGVVAKKLGKSEAISGIFLNKISKVEVPFLLKTQL